MVKGGDLTVQRGPGRRFRVPAEGLHLAGDLQEVASGGTFAQVSTGTPVSQTLRNNADGHVDMTML